MPVPAVARATSYRSPPCCRRRREGRVIVVEVEEAALVPEKTARALHAPVTPRLRICY